MIVNRKSKQKVNKKIEHLNNIKKQIDLTGTYKIFHQIIAEYMFFSSVYEHFPGNTHTHMLAYKANLMVLNIMVIQVYAPTSNAEEAEVERFYEDVQDLLE